MQAAAWRISRLGGFCYVLPGDEFFNGADEVHRPVSWLKTASPAELKKAGAEACTFANPRPDDRLHRAIFHKFDGLVIRHVAEQHDYREAAQKVIDWLQPYADAGSDRAKDLIEQARNADCFDEVEVLAGKSHVLVI
jgi:hypothetical protein